MNTLQNEMISKMASDLELESAFKLFKQYMAVTYREKTQKYGDSWRTCSLKILKDHIAKHSIHLQESDYGKDELAGMGLLCMFLLWRKFV